MILKGIFAALTSVLNEDLSLDIKLTINHAFDVVKNGSNVAFLGSTSQAQLISVSEKTKLIEKLSENNFQKNCLIGTGCNSLKENINLMKHSIKNGFDKFLLMNPAYYKNTDEGVYNFYDNIIQQVPDSKIILYNFSTLSGYTFSADVVRKLVSDFPKNIVGMKDSTGNLFNNLKISDFSMFVGSEIQLLKALELGCAGCISATTNVTHSLARKVYDDFINKRKQTVNEKLCTIRKIFDDSGDLISAVHSFMSEEDVRYKRILPPLTLLSLDKRIELLHKLKQLDFVPKKNMAA